MTREPDDQRAMRAAQDGDQAALAELYDRYSPLLYGVALRILRNESDAEDVLQEAWVQAWKSRVAWDSKRGTVASWLVTIARTRALDRVRSRASRRKAEEGLEMQPVAPPRTPEDEAARSGLAMTMAGALAALPEKHRQCLESAYFDGLTQSEIAAKLGAPLGSVKFWMRQGLLRLRELVPGGGEA
ncbi:MAG: sigma-70 family RNA polymerase sigma factor [Candidatus Eiseniibacteriota bacterium]